MIIAPNSLVRQEEEAQGEEEEEVGGRRKGGPIGTPTPDADAPTSNSLNGLGCEEQKKKWTVGGVGFHSIGGAD